VSSSCFCVLTIGAASLWDRKCSTMSHMNAWHPRTVWTLANEHAIIAAVEWEPQGSLQFCEWQMSSLYNITSGYRIILMLSTGVGIRLLHCQHLGWNHHGDTVVGPCMLSGRLSDQWHFDFLETGAA
jgi:hypothetical protein